MPEKNDDIRIKEPDAPASDAQLGLIDALAAAGVVSAEELAALGGSPSKQAASDLISAHADEEGFKDVQAARAAEREQAKKENAAQDKSKSDFAHVKIPNAFVHPYTFDSKDGRTFEKAYVNFPKGTKVNGIDIGGYSCDVFMTDRMKQQMLSDEQVTLGFKGDESVAIWTGSKDDPEHPYQRFEVNPWELCKGLKAEFDAFKAGKAAEREQSSAQDVTLKAESESCREASSALSGDDMQEKNHQAERQ